MNNNDRIGIIGSDILGLACATKLEEKGYTNYELLSGNTLIHSFEKIELNGFDFMVGNNQINESNVDTKSILEKYKIEYTSKEVNFEYRNFIGKKEKPFKLSKEIFSRLSQVRKVKKLLSKDSINFDILNEGTCNDDFYQSIHRYCEDHHIARVEEFLSALTTPFGLGYTTNFPMYKLLMFMKNRDKKLGVVANLEIKNKEWPNEWNKNLLHPAILNTSIINITFKNNMVQLFTQNGIKEYDKIIITDLNLLTNETKGALGLNDINNIQLNREATFIYSFKNGPEENQLFIKNYVEKRVGHIAKTIFHQINGKKYLQINTYLNNTIETISKEEANTRILRDLAKMNFSNVVLEKEYTYTMSPYTLSSMSHQVSLPLFAEQQGKNNLYLLNEVNTVDTINDKITYTNWFIDKYFK